MSLYPSAPDIFVNRTGADVIASSDPNNAYDAIEAIQGFLGSSGQVQSHNAALTDYLLDTYMGGRCYKSDANNIFVGKFRGTIANAGGTIKKFRVSSSVSTLTASNIDTGSFAVGYYYIYATADTASTAPVFVISANAVTPTGSTFYRRLGWFYNETINILDITGGKISTFIGGDNDIQVLSFGSGALGTSSTTIPADDTIPQITEGYPFMSYPFIPTSALHRVRVDVLFNYASSAGYEAICALFQGAGADAIAASGNIDTTANNEVQQLIVTYVGTPGTTAPIVYQVRAGLGTAGAINFNGTANTRRYGGVNASRITITELKP